jgi:rhamnosyltransferase
MAIQDDRICAVVTAYFPDSGFEQRLAAVLPQVDALVVVDNTPGGGCQHRLSPFFAPTPQATVIEMGDNKGIAAALNKGLEYAMASGCNLIISLDQDTLCYPHMVNTLMSVRAEVAASTAVIGGNYFDARNGKFKVSERGPQNWLKQKTVITSGCLINSAVVAKVGGFRDDYFIDQVDHEFCLRLRRHGYGIAITRKPIMVHSVGEADGPKLPLLGALPGQSPLRKYYVARNSLVTIATYLRTDFVWGVVRFSRLMLGLLSTLIFEKNKIIKTQASLLGCLDAARYRMGPCRWKLLTEPKS